MKELVCGSTKEGLEESMSKRTNQHHLGLEPREYPNIAEESLIAFKFNQEGSEAFRKSLSDWKRILRGLDTEPNETLILDEMRKLGIGSKQKQSVYNFDDVKAVTESWAHAART